MKPFRSGTKRLNGTSEGLTTPLSTDQPEPIAVRAARLPGSCRWRAVATPCQPTIFDIFRQISTTIAKLEADGRHSMRGSSPPLGGLSSLSGTQKPLPSVPDRPAPGRAANPTDRPVTISPCLPCAPGASLSICSNLS